MKQRKSKDNRKKAKGFQVMELSDAIDFKMFLPKEALVLMSTGCCV